jgi:hypothetical protein
MKRRLFNAAALMLLALSFAALALGVRSYWVLRRIVLVNPIQTVALDWERGSLSLRWIDTDSEGWTFKQDVQSEWSQNEVGAWVFASEPIWVSNRDRPAGRFVRFPFWLASAALAVPGPIWAWHRWTRRGFSTCPACGYDLRGTPSGGTCPECGADSGEREAKA